MPTEARVEVVQAVTSAMFRRLSRAEREMAAGATDTELEVATLAVAHAREAMRLLEEVGILRVPSVLDLTDADVDLAYRRWRALHRERYELGGRWRQGMTLGEVLKVGQPELVAAAVRRLRAAGFTELPDPEVTAWEDPQQ